jgi:hypothetical protein
MAWQASEQYPPLLKDTAAEASKPQHHPQGLKEKEHGQAKPSTEPRQAPESQHQPKRLQAEEPPKVP